MLNHNGHSIDFHLAIITDLRLYREKDTALDLLHKSRFLIKEGSASLKQVIKTSPVLSTVPKLNRTLKPSWPKIIYALCR